MQSQTATVWPGPQPLRGFRPVLRALAITECILGLLIFSVVSAVILVLLTFVVKPLIFLPDRVFEDSGENVLVYKNPTKLNSNKGQPLVVPVSSITKIQLASNIVTLFNKSGNAIDIPVPNPKFTMQVFQNAQTHFKKAEVVEIHS